MGMDWCVDCDHYLVCKYVDYDRWSCSRFKHYGNTEEGVRCKDCKYKFSANGHNKNGCPLDGAGLMNDNDFCSYGERKDNAK